MQQEQQDLLEGPLWGQRRVRGRGLGTVAAPPSLSRAWRGKELPKRNPPWGKGRVSGSDILNTYRDVMKIKQVNVENSLFEHLKSAMEEVQILF